MICMREPRIEKTEKQKSNGQMRKRSAPIGPGNLLSGLILVLIIMICLSSCINEKKEIVAEFGDQHLTLDEFRGCDQKTRYV
jgi:hypothetical protein